MFMVTQTFYDERRERKLGWTCPNGHSRVFRESESKRIQKLLNAERERSAFARQQLEKEQNRHRATKGQLTKAKRRAANGVCPCCKRSFVQLRRHMEKKHPGFVTSV